MESKAPSAVDAIKTFFSPVVPLNEEEIQERRKVWQPPVELSEQKIPRTPKLKYSYLAANLIAIIGLIVLMIAIAFSHQRYLSEMRASTLVLTTGSHTSATIGEKILKSGFFGPKYLLTYTLDIDGRPYQRQLAVASNFYSKYPSGKSLPALYLPNDPSISYLEEENRPMDEYPIQLCYPLACISLYFLLLKILPLRKYWDLARYGIPAAGFVYEIHSYRSKTVIRYRFWDRAGQEHQGRHSVEWSISRPTTQDPCTVLYRPDDPEINMFYPHVVGIRSPVTPS